MAMYDLYLFSKDDVSKYRKEAEYSRKSSLSVYDHHWDMVHFQPVSEVSYSFAIVISVSDYDDFVSSSYELL